METKPSKITISAEYQDVFNAIAKAVTWEPEKSIAVSVEAFLANIKKADALPEGLTPMFLLNVAVLAEGIVDVDPEKRKEILEKLHRIAKQLPGWPS